MTYEVVWFTGNNLNKKNVYVENQQCRTYKEDQKKTSIVHFVNTFRQRFYYL